MKILLADDDPVPLKLAERAVALSLHDAIIARDGGEAWEKFLSEPVDLVISDWNMPILDGLELCRKIRRHGYHDVYFILMSASTLTERIAAEIMDAGVDDFVSKPAAVRWLTSRIILAERMIDMEFFCGKATARPCALIV